MADYPDSDWYDDSRHGDDTRCWLFVVIALIKHNRKKKKDTYTGVTQGTVTKIENNRLNHSWLIRVSYCVSGVHYEISESANLKYESGKEGVLVRTFSVGAIREGDPVEVHYDKNHPEKAIIFANDGVFTG